MKFLLIYGTEMNKPSVHKQQFELHGPVYPPLGLLYVGRSLEDEGHKAEIIDFFVEHDAMTTIKHKLSSADAIGISVDNDSYHESAQIAHTIKTIDPDIPIIIGGPHCTLYPEKALKNLPAADISVCGDGEQTIKNITHALEGKKPLSEIPGIHYREKQQIKKGKPPELIDNLDDIPFPARHLVDDYDYGKFGNTHLFTPPLTSMITTRGCPFRCRYCIRHIISYKSFRQRTAENVLREFKEINDSYGSVMIADDTFLADKKRAHQVLDGLIQMGSSLDILIGGARVDSADKDLYMKMKKAGVKYISYGIESGNQDVLDFYNKGVTIEQIHQSVQLSHKMGFFVNGTFIFGAPFETIGHFKRTIHLACSLPFDIVAFYPLSYRHGSDLWLDAVKKESIREDEHEVIADSKRNLGNFTREQILQWCTIASQKFYMRPRYVLSQLQKALRTKNPHILQSEMLMFLHSMK